MTDEISDRVAEAILGLVETDRQLREPAHEDLAQVVLHAYRPHDRHAENRLIGPKGLTSMEIVQAFYGVEGGREFLVNFLAEQARPGEHASGQRQRWERRIGGADVAEVAVHFDVDQQGRAGMHPTRIRGFSVADVAPEQVQQIADAMALTFTEAAEVFDDVIDAFRPVPLLWQDEGDQA